MQHHEGLVEEKTDISTPPLCLLEDMIEVCFSLLVSNEWETLSPSCLCVLVLALLNAESKEDKLQLSGPVRHRGGEEVSYAV